MTTRHLRKTPNMKDEAQGKQTGNTTLGGNIISRKIILKDIREELHPWNKNKLIYIFKRNKESATEKQNYIRNGNLSGKAGRYPSK